MKRCNRSYRQTGNLVFAITACLLVRSIAAQETTFEDVTAAAGLGGGDFVAWADYDHDGDVDLVTGGYLFKNNGKGSFTRSIVFRVATGLGPTTTMTVVWITMPLAGRANSCATWETINLKKSRSQRTRTK